MLEHLANLYSMFKVKAVKVSVEIIVIVLIYTAGDLRNFLHYQGDSAYRRNSIRGNDIGFKTVM